MSELMDIVVKATDNASKVLQQIGDSSGKVATTMVDHWKGISVALGGFAIGLEALGRQQNELTVQTLNLAGATGITSGAMRDIVGSTANANFSVEDVIATMKIGRQEGLKSADQLKSYANYWNMVSLATGESVTDLADAAVALNAVGLEAGDAGNTAAAFGFITRETTLSVKEFMDFIGKSGIKLKEMGLNINDTAALLKILSENFGISGKQAKLILGKAIADSNGDFAELLKNLGISQSQFAQWSGTVEKSGKVLKDQAKNQKDNTTWMQKLNAEVKKLAYNYGDLIGQAANFSTIIPAIGPTIKGFEMAGRGGEKAWKWAKSLPSTLKMISEQGISATANAGKAWPAIKKVGSSIGSMASKAAQFVATGFTAVMAGIAAAGASTVITIIAVAASILVLVASIISAVWAYGKWRKALAEEQEALTMEEQAYADTYNMQGAEALEAQFEKDKASMNSNTQRRMLELIVRLEKTAPTGQYGGSVVPMASGGIITRPTLVLAGEDGPEEFTPLGKGGVRTVHHKGTIRVEGVDNRGMLQAVMPLVIDEVRREVRGNA
jgi:hypothetical protein